MKRFKRQFTVFPPKNDVNSWSGIHENTVNYLWKRFISWIVPFDVKSFHVPTNSTISDTIRYLNYLENAARIKLKTSDIFPKGISAFQNLFQINLILEMESQLSNYSNKIVSFRKKYLWGFKMGHFERTHHISDPTTLLAALGSST